jgi:hypothetical protein
MGRRGQKPSYAPATTAASRKRGWGHRDPTRLTTQQKNALRRLVAGYGPLSYAERETARRYHAMGLLKTNNIKDPSYVTLSPAGEAALRSR